MMQQAGCRSLVPSLILHHSGGSNPFCASFHLPFAPLCALFYLSSHFLPPAPFVPLTGGDDALQPDDVGVVKLSQDAGLAEEGAPLLVRAAGAQRLDGHRQLPLAGQLEAAAANLAKITWGGAGRGGK